MPNKMKKRILYINDICAPFWVEFAKAVNMFEDLEFRVAFCESSLQDRGIHWKHFNNSDAQHYCYQAPSSKNAKGRGNGLFSTIINVFSCRFRLLRKVFFQVDDEFAAWLNGIYLSYKPDIIIVGGGGVINNNSLTAIKLALDRQVILGILAEQPNVAFPLKQLLKKLLYRVVLNIAKPKFFLAVGDRAADFYRNLTSLSCHVAMFPYYQDLTPNFNIHRNKIGTPVKFLFSGRLLQRFSVKEMTLAFERLAERRPGLFKWCISGHGPEEQFVRAVMCRSKNFAETVSFVREFNSWNDRLIPFAESDILVVPAHHSGWGLVVPEALAAGMPVITTRYVEAARYYVEDMINGIFVEPNTDSIYRALEYCVDNIEIMNRLQNETRQSAMRGDVKYGAKRLALLINRWFS